MGKLERRKQFFQIFTVYLTWAKARVNRFCSMRTFKRIIFSLVFICLGAGVQAQTPKYSNEFLAIGAGARGLAMSGAFIGTVNDATAGYWNPAALTGIKSDLEVAAMHAEYFAGIAKYDYGAIAKPIDSSSVVAFSVIRFGVDNIPNTTKLIDANGNLNYDRITTFSATDYGFLLSYARKLNVKGLSVGGNFKVVHRIIGSFAHAWGFGLDVGVHYSRNNWTFAAVGRDVTTTVNSWTYTLDDETKRVFQQTGNELPPNGYEITLPRLVIGAARTFKWNRISLNAELNGTFTFDGRRNVLFSGNPMSVDPVLGFELGYSNLVFLRAGIGNIQRERDYLNTERVTIQPNMGLGLKLNRLSVDYAYTDFGNQSAALYSNIFSLKFDVEK